MAATYAGWYVVSRPFTGYATLAAFADSRYQNVAPFFYLSRGLSAAMGAATVWLVFSLCRRAFDDTVAIVAALFTALAYLHVRDSHFGTTDVTMTALVVLAVGAILRWRDVGGWRTAALAGLAGGLATSTKYNALGVLLPFAIAAVARATSSGSGTSSNTQPSMWLTGARRETLSVAVYGAAFVAAFLATSPYVLVERQRFLQDVVEPGRMLATAFAAIPLRGWSQYAVVTLPAALGWPMYAAGVAGVAGALVRSFTRAAIVFAFPVGYYLVAGSGHTAFARYIVPVLPFLAIGAAWLVVSAVRACTPLGAARAQGAIIGVAACLVVLPSARNIVLLDRIFTHEDTRLTAARALSHLIPEGSVVYHSGDPYGRVPFDIPGVTLEVNLCDYDEASARFGGGVARPEWIILQRSPLVFYSRVPAGIEQLVRNSYDLVRVFSPGEGTSRAIYDQQDAFFVPLAGLEGTTSPGPRVEVYRARPSSTAR